MLSTSLLLSLLAEGQVYQIARILALQSLDDFLEGKIKNTEPSKYTEGAEYLDYLVVFFSSAFLVWLVRLPAKPDYLGVDTSHHRNEKHIPMFPRGRKLTAGVRLDPLKTLQRFECTPEFVEAMNFMGHTAPVRWVPIILRPHKVTTAKGGVIPHSMGVAVMPELFIVRETKKEVVNDLESTLVVVSALAEFICCCPTSSL
jgi:hypothetical protein